MEERKISKKILWIIIPVLAVLIIGVIVTAAIAITIANTKSEVKVELICTNLNYSLGTAPVFTVAYIEPSSVIYGFYSKKAKAKFLEEVLKDKNIVAEFENEEEKITLFADDGNLFGIAHYFDSNNIHFYQSISFVDCEKTKALLFPMIDFYPYQENNLDVGQSITVAYDKINYLFHGAKFTSYEEYRAMFEKSNKDIVIAKFDDANKKIILKGSLYNNRELLAYKKVELTFSYTEIKITYTGEDW